MQIALVKLARVAHDLYDGSDRTVGGTWTGGFGRIMT